MGFFEKFRKLCAVLKRKECHQEDSSVSYYRELERQQIRMGVQIFLARRGIGKAGKPVAVVRPMPRKP